MFDLVESLQSAPQAVSTPTCQTVAEVQQAVWLGLVILQLDAHSTYLSVYDTQWSDDADAGVVEFTGHYRLHQKEWNCRVHLDRQTLRGSLQLAERTSSPSGLIPLE